MRIFLIEDDELLGDGLKAGLELAGWVVDWVQDGVAARAALSDEQFDLVVLDLGLPLMSGTEVLRWLRRRRNPVPVLVLTARDSPEDRVIGLDAGADDYVSKPFDLNEVCARLRALHRRCLGCASPMVRYRGLVIDPSSRCLAVDGRVVALTPKELAIAQVLLENAGKVMPRERLMASIYGWDDDIGSNVLEVHIHNLRKKLDSVVVKAVRGVGYRLD